MTKDFRECACDQCKGGCTNIPGWFKPDELEPLATAMGMTLQYLFDRHLALDFWGRSEDEGGHIWLVTPGRGMQLRGHEVPWNPRGVCTFYRGDGTCSIHEHGKPYECKMAHHEDPMPAKGPPAEHYDAAMAWDNPAAQALVRRLLGREPLTRQIAIACGIPHSILVGERLQPVNVYDALLPHQDPYATRQFSDFVRAMWDREADHV